MPEGDLWTQIPSILLDAAKAGGLADKWAEDQRQKIADKWAETQKNGIALLEGQWQDKASMLATPAMTQDDFNASSPDSVGRLLPGEALPTASFTPNPADVLSQTASHTFDAQPHLQDGTPENNFVDSMREGASHSGIYIPPPPGAAVDRNKELTLQLQAEQNRTRPTIGPGGLGLFNPTLVPDTLGGAAPPKEASQAAGEIFKSVPIVGEVLKHPIIGTVANKLLGIEGTEAPFGEIALPNLFGGLPSATDAANAAGNIAQGANNLAQGASSTIRGEMVREGNTVPGMTGALTRGLVGFTDTMGQQAAQNRAEQDAAYTPTRTASDDPKLTQQQRYESQFTPEQLASQRKIATDMAMSVTGGSDLEVDKAVAAGAKEALTPILGGKFYSQAEKLINDLVPADKVVTDEAGKTITTGRATGQQILGTLVGKGVKAGELEWTGLKKFLEDKGKAPVTKQELQDFIRNNIVQIQEVPRGIHGPPATPEQLDYQAKKQFGTDYNSLSADDKEYVDASSEHFYGSTAHANMIREQGVQLQEDLYNALHEPSPDPQKIEGLKSALAAKEAEAEKVRAYVPPEQTKWEDKVLAGGKNYREYVLTLPQKFTAAPPLEQLPSEYPVVYRQDLPGSARFAVYDPATHERIAQGITRENARDAALMELNSRRATAPPVQFQSAHWSEPNVLLHLRVDDRLSPEGDPMIFMQEGQSDWAQKGEKQGFNVPNPNPVTEIPSGVEIHPIERNTVGSDSETVGYKVQTYGPEHRDLRDLEDNYYPSEEAAKKAVLDKLNENPPSLQKVQDKARIDQINQELDKLQWPTARTTNAISETDKIIAKEQARIQEAVGKGEPVDNAALKSASRARQLLVEKGRLEKRVASGKYDITPAPFTQNSQDWMRLAFKRMVALAAETGKTAIGWTTGIQQDRIEGLIGRYKELSYDPVAEKLTMTKPDGRLITRAVPPDALEGTIGGDLAQRLLSSPTVFMNREGQYVAKAAENAAPVHRLVGSDLEVGTKGMAGSYDKMWPNVVAGEGKPYQTAPKAGEVPTSVPPVNTDDIKLTYRPDGAIDVYQNGAVEQSYPAWRWAEAEQHRQALLQQRVNERSTEPIKEVVHYINLPAKMLEDARKGQALFSPASVGGAVTGAVYGAQQGNTPEERLQNAAKYGVGGFLAGHVLTGGQLPFGMSIKPTFTDPALQRAAEMFHAEAPKANFLEGGTVAERAIRDITRSFTNNRIDMYRLQESVAQKLGRPLNANEQLAELSLLNPDSAAELNIRKNLAPALQLVGQQDQTALSMYLTYRHNIEVAHAMGEKEFNRVVNQPLKNLPAATQLKSLQSRLTMYNRFLQQGVTANDGTVIMHYQPMIEKTQKLIANAQKRLSAQTQTSRSQQALEALASGQNVAHARSFAGDQTLDGSMDALASLEQELGPDRFQKVEQAAQQVVSFGHSLLQREVNAGIITQDLADHLNQMYPEYVPTRILDRMIEPITTPGGSTRALSMRDDGIRALTQEGPLPESQLEDPIASMVRKAYSVESMARKNETFNALHNLAQAQLSNGLPILQGVVDQVKPTASATATKKIVSGFVDGVPTYYQMPRDLADAIENQPFSPIPGLQAIMSVQRALLASASPLFIPTHAMITAIPYMIRTATREGGPQALPRVLGALGSAYYDAFKGLGTGRYGPDTERYVSQGGAVFGHLFDYSPASAKASLEDLARVNAFQMHSPADARRIVISTLKGKPFTEALNRLDLAPRVAAAKLAEARGLNPVAAVSEGRQVTVDPSLGGTFVKQINQFIPFFNIAMQGAVAPLRAARENPKAFVGSALAVLAAPTAAVEAWNRSDPQRAKDYSDVPNFYKDSGIVIMAPQSAEVDANGNRKPNFVYIPTRSYSPFVVATRELVGRVMGAQPRSWQSLLYGNNLMYPDGGVLAGAAPFADATRLIPGGPLGDTAVAALTGINPTTGGHIASQVGNQRAGAVAHGITNIGNAGERALGVSPGIQSSQVQYGIDQFGGPGRVVGSIGQPQGEGQPLIPLLRNTTGQNLKDVQAQRISPALRSLLNDAGLPDVTPAAQVVSGLPLSPQEEAELQTNLNAAFEQVAQQVSQNPRYQQWSQAQRAIYLKDVLARTRAIVGEKFLRTLSQRDGVDAIRQRLRNAKAVPKAS